MFQAVLDSSVEFYSPPRQQSEDTLLSHFNTNFKTLTGNGPDVLQLAHRLRYQVYCVEKRFEEAADYADQLERDEYDAHAAHGVLVDRLTQEPVGTVRLILPVPNAPNESLPMQRVCQSSMLKNLLPLKSTAEISRLGISRQCAGDTARASALRHRASRHSPLMRLGLMQMAVRMSVQNGITHWCAIIEPTMIRMMAAIGIYAQPIGRLVEYHGWRQPCFCNLADALRDAKRDRPAFWEVLTDGGTL